MLLQNYGIFTNLQNKKRYYLFEDNDIVIIHVCSKLRIFAIILWIA